MATLLASHNPCSAGGGCDDADMDQNLLNIEPNNQCVLDNGDYNLVCMNCAMKRSEQNKAGAHELQCEHVKRANTRNELNEGDVDGAKDYVATSPNPHTATMQSRALSSEGDDSSEAGTYKVKLRDKQSDKDISMNSVGDNEQLKAALIIIVAMSGTVKMKPRDNDDGSNDMTVQRPRGLGEYRAQVQ